MPKIVRIISRLSVSGPSLHVIVLHQGLRPFGYETTVVVGKEGAHEGSMVSEAQARGIEPLVIEELAREINLASDVTSLLKLVRMLRHIRPDVVHTHHAKAGFVGRVAAWLVGVPVILHTYHGHVFHGYFGRRKTAVFLWLERLLSRMSTRVITISDQLKTELVDYGIAPASKIVVIPLRLELDQFVATCERGRFRREIGVPNEVPLVGMVGRLVPIKNVPLFIEAALLVRDRVPGTRFVVVGDGELRGFLEVEARRWLGDSMYFTGLRRDLPRIYADIDVVALTSLNEGTPVALIEAMAAARPVVATDVGGVRDVVVHGETGFVVPSGSAEAVAAAIGRLIRDPVASAAMGERGRARALSRFGSDRLVSEMATLLNDLLGQSQR